MPETVLHLHPGMPEASLRAMRGRFDLVEHSRASAAADLLPEADRIRGVVTIGVIGIDRALIERLPKLGIIACYGSGYERIDVAAARERGVVVTSNTGANAACVADMALALLLASVRRLGEGDRFIRAGRWTRAAAPAELISTGLAGRRVGILGLGAIGERIARRAAAFDMEVAYHNRRPKPGVPWTYHPTLASLAEWADILVVSCRSDESTRGIVDRSVLAALGPKGHVINIARGEVLDEAALIAALESGAIAGAGLDGFEHEPEVPEALKRLENVVLAPHIASLTEAAHREMCRMTIESLENFFAGRPLPNAV
ncbi:2-hydroxyacid dehydrogenase [Inquilinus limosus]|uniref:2-hydroxyacid dehydrogenase n=1 Tax=Inquilinus limosus TaxID=171674 RepID=UPI00041B69E3|nr:2-hydroxyacid dehydrogenase [Inquilinus limosus]